MKDNVKRVFYVRYVAHPCYLDIIAQRPEIRLDKLENESSDDVAEAIMAAAHAYQIGSSRDELNPRFYARRELLARMSNLLVVSTNGAGFDTVNVKDCTEAGGARGQSDRRQRRGGGRACACHAARALKADRADQPCFAARHDARPQRLHG